jgi:tetratricopeptide (TPR) repeat protein
MAQKICESHPSQDEDVRRLLIDIHYCRGSEASESNQPQLCLEQFSSHLKLCQQVVSETGMDNEALASAYNEVGVAYMMNKKYGEGMRAFHKSIDIYKSLEHFTTAMTAFPLANLGLSLWLQGRCDEAAEVLHKALLDRAETFGHDDKESEK